MSRKEDSAEEVSPRSRPNPKKKWKKENEKDVVGSNLISDRKVLALLSAAAHPAVQALVHVAVVLVGAVSAVVLLVAEAAQRDAATVGAHEEGAVA